MSDTQDWIEAKEEFGDKMRSISRREFEEKCNRCRYENGKLTKPCVICAAKGLQDCIDETEPTNEQKSKFIFEELEMGGCWHEFPEGEKYCIKCGKHFLKCGIQPNFFTSDADCRKALMLLPMKHSNEFGFRLTQILPISNVSSYVLDIAMSTPAQKAEAIYQTLKNREIK